MGGAGVAERPRRLGLAKDTRCVRVSYLTEGDSKLSHRPRLGPRFGLTALGIGSVCRN